MPVVFCEIHYHLFVLQKQLKETAEDAPAENPAERERSPAAERAVESHKVSLEKKRSLSQSQFRLTEA